MDPEFALEAAKEIMRQLSYHGNFDEFFDDNEPDRLNEGVAQIIANGLMGAWDKRVEARLRLKAKKRGCICPKKCDCASPDTNPAGVSNACPEHNLKPDPVPGCPIHWVAS